MKERLRRAALFTCINNNVIANQPAGWCGNLSRPVGNLQEIATPVWALARNDIYFLKFLGEMGTFWIRPMICPERITVSRLQAIRLKGM